MMPFGQACTGHVNLLIGASFPRVLVYPFHEHLEDRSTHPHTRPQVQPRRHGQPVTQADGEATQQDSTHKPCQPPDVREPRPIGIAKCATLCSLPCKLMHESIIFWAPVCDIEGLPCICGHIPSSRACGGRSATVSDPNGGLHAICPA